MVGKIYFLLVRIKIKHMEISIIKRETAGTGTNMYNENDTLAKYEIMDGAPVRGINVIIIVSVSQIYNLTVKCLLVMLRASYTVYSDTVLLIISVMWPLAEACFLVLYFVFVCRRIYSYQIVSWCL